MKRKDFYFFIYLLILFLVQTAAQKVFAETLYLVPQFTLLFVLVFALTHPLVETLWVGFGIGFLQEFFSGQFFGAEIFSITVVGVLVYFITRKFMAQEISVLTSVLLVIMATGVFVLCIYLFSLATGLLNLGDALSAREVFSLRLIWTAVLNLIFFYPLKAGFRLAPQDR